MQTSEQSLQMAARRGVEALQRGDAEEARNALDEVVRSGRATPQLWLLFAESCFLAGDYERASEALDQVLASEPRNAFALIMKGDLFVRRDDERAALSYYQAALKSVQGAADLPGVLPDRLAHAARAAETIQRKFEDHLRQELSRGGFDRLPPRLAEALAIASGRQEIYLQQPTSFYYPGLPNIAWYDPAEFEWAKAFEEAAEEIVAEVRPILDEGATLEPYVRAPKDRPSRGHSLLDDPRWSAFYLWRDGALVADNAARCPTLMRLLELPPIPRIAGRSPMAMISILRPGTHIPPHSGMLNTRLICHLPLIVPDGCRLRVGAETRPVRFAKTMIFDDSIDHEAWNDGDGTRAVLIFEIWRPELSDEERAALTVLFESIGGYSVDNY